MLEFITPHPEITYLIASRCPPKAFDMLKDCKVVIWHSGGDRDTEELLIKYKRHEPMLIGGTAAVTRSMILAPYLGYRELHLWGADSSFKNGETHIRKSTTDEKRTIIKVGDRVFDCAPWMTQQADDLKALLPALRLHGIDMTVHGDGLLPYTAMLLGVKTDLEITRGRVVREWKHRAKTLWQYL
jgi:hypothetical protein